MSPKELRQRFGVTGSPLQVSTNAKVFVKEMEYNPEHAGAIQTKSWIVVDGNTLHRSNTYNGNIGRGGNPAAPYNTEVVADEKTLAKKVKGYTLVDTSTCPFVAVA